MLFQFPRSITFRFENPFAGARGEVSIPYKTVDGLAKAGKDYEHREGALRFKDNQTK